MDVRKGFFFALLFVVFAVASCSSGDGKKFVFSFEEYDFGGIELRSMDSVQFTIENVSGNSYSLQNFRLSGTNAADFTLIGGGTYMILPKEIKQFTIEFEPQEEGLRTALFEFDSDASKNPYQFMLQGTGVAKPEFKLSHTSFDCGKVYVTFSKSFDFEIENDGTGVLNVTQMTISGPNASDFTITAGLAPVTVDPSFTHPTAYTHTFTIEYAPLVAGTSDAILEIMHDADGSPATLTLTGTAEDPFSDMKIDPTTYKFSGVLTGNTDDKEFEIESNGVLALNISDIEIVAGTSTEFSIKEVFVDGTPVAPAPYACQVPVGKKCLVTVTFAPTSDGQGKTSTLKITSDGLSSPVDVNLEGSTGFPVLINECYMGTDDYVELYNTSSSPINISGWRLQCFYLRSGSNTPCGDYYFPNNAIIPPDTCVTCPESSKAGDYPIGTNIMWIGGDGGEAILSDNNGNGVDYMFFNMSNPDHIPSNLSWNGASIPNQGEVDHYRHSKTNTFSATDWSFRTSSSDYGSKNPGQ